MKKVIILEDNCIACYNCEVACVAEHSRTKDPVKAYKLENLRGKSNAVVEISGPVAFSLMCRHCKHPWCLDACISGAIQRLENGIVYLNEDRCVACWGCVLACPYGATHPLIRDDRKHAFKCDLCIDRLEAGLNPACVEACPNRALIFEEPVNLEEKERRYEAMAVHSDRG